MSRPGDEHCPPIDGTEEKVDADVPVRVMQCPLLPNPSRKHPGRRRVYRSVPRPAMARA